MFFETAGITVFPLWPFLAAFGVSLVCSTAGISGAFLLLPYQISVLGYTSPGVSATNQIFNILACPAGVLRYAREKRLLTPLALFIAAGTLPGVFFGAIIRIWLLSSLRPFLGFAALMLFYLGYRMIAAEKAGKGRSAKGAAICQNVTWSWRGFSFEYDGERHAALSRGIIILSLLVGLAGGIYGVGGGAIMAPILIAAYGFPVHAIAGATLFATFLTSIAGTGFYWMLARLTSNPATAPDWALGLILGLGGIIGMYCGAALQKHISGRALKALLMVVVFSLALRYFWQFILG